MYKVTMNLVNDWTKTVKEVLEGSGIPVEKEDDAAALTALYYLQTMPEQQAKAEADHTLQRLREMEATIREHLDSTIVPDIRKRTGYEGMSFHFCWVYNQGEHIVELESEYRIPLSG